MMEYNTIITISSISLCIILFLRSVLSKIATKKQNNAIEVLQKELQAIQENKEEEQKFQNNLKHAEVNTKLQKSRTAYSNKKVSLQAPERYGYALAMFQSGLTAEKIGSTLGMSGHEINQLSKLTNIRVP